MAFPHDLVIIVTKASLKSEMWFEELAHFDCATQTPGGGLGPS